MNIKNLGSLIENPVGVTLGTANFRSTRVGQKEAEIIKIASDMRNNLIEY